MTNIYNTLQNYSTQTTTSLNEAVQKIRNPLERSLEWIRGKKGVSLAIGLGIGVVGALALPLIGDYAIYGMSEVLPFSYFVKLDHATSTCLRLSTMAGFLGLIGYARNRLLNGDRHEGSCVEGEKHGQGTSYFPDGDRYEGSWVEGKKHGEGTCYFLNGDLYEGSWAQDKQHGEGTCYFANGDRYEGSWVEDKAHGEGTFYFADGGWYQGGWVENKQYGQGTYYSADSDSFIEGNWRNDVFVTDRSYLNHPAFLKSLLDKTLIIKGIPLSILADHFRTKKEHFSIAETLQSALDVSLDPIASLEKIIDDLGNNKPRLLPFGTPNHTMLLEIVPGEESYIFKVYNSGLGIEHHEKELFGHRYQTELRIQVPKQRVDRQVIEKLVSPDEGMDVYEFLFGLPGAKKIKNPNPVFQKPQKGDNCVLESVFAYLKNTLGEEQYHQMRIGFFDACIEALQDRSTPGSVRSEFLPKLLQKRSRRAARKSLNNSVCRKISKKIFWLLTRYANS